jgi:hypothetical protein
MELVYVDRQGNGHEIQIIRDLLAAFEFDDRMLDALIDLFKSGIPASDDWHDLMNDVCGVVVN